jgi:hypothetical protein
MRGDLRPVHLADMVLRHRDIFPVQHTVSTVLSSFGACEHVIRDPSCVCLGVAC